MLETEEDIFARLGCEFPGKKIIDLGSEIIAEVDPSEDHPEYSTAIAYIFNSAPHYHDKTVETYTVQEGSVVLLIEGEEKMLHAGDRYVINPGLIHSARGDWARVEVISNPGWTPEDHIIIGQNGQ